MTSTDLASLSATTAADARTWLCRRWQIDRADRRHSFCLDDLPDETALLRFHRLDDGLEELELELTVGR